MMKKYLIILACAIAVLSCVAWGTYEWLDSGTIDNKETEAKSDNESEKDKEKPKPEKDAAKLEKLAEEREKTGGTITEEDLAAFKEEGLNPFGQEATIHELTDLEYQEYIHGMSHQKVKAAKKWGFYEIHPKRIKWLLNGLDKVELKHEGVYQAILDRWSNGEFAGVVGDHNAIWRIQDGTVGKAIRVLSPEEEQDYIDSKT